MKVYQVSFVGSVSVEANSEDEAVSKAEGWAFRSIGSGHEVSLEELDFEGAELFEDDEEEEEDDTIELDDVPF